MVPHSATIVAERALEPRWCPGRAPTSEALIDLLVIEASAVKLQGAPTPDKTVPR